MAILITGTPGTGKTTLAKMIAEKRGVPYISLRDFVFERKLIVGWDEERDAWIIDLDATRKYLEEILSCREVIDTHVVEAVPPGKISRVVVLRLNPLELKERLERRGYLGKKIKENVEAEVLGLIAASAYTIFGKENVLEIDVTGKSPLEALRAVLSALEKGVGSTVDWLEEYWFLLE